MLATLAVDFGWLFQNWVVATIIVLGVLIFVHELGHFLTAKAVDIEVPRFSIGFGPKVVGFRRGETEYVISALPLGGYVKMAGMEEMEAIEGGDTTLTEMVEHRKEGAPRTVRPRDFESKPLWARALVISAGVIMNLLFAFVVFSAIAMVWGVVRDRGPVLTDVREELLPPGTEVLATLPPGTTVSRVGTRDVSTWAELQRAILQSRAGPLDLTLADGASVRIELPAADSLRGSLLGAIQPHRESAAVLGDVVSGSAAEGAGLEAGDRIIRADGQPVSTWQDFAGVIEASPGRPLVLEVQRDSQLLQIPVTPEEHRQGARSYGRIGVMAAPISPDLVRVGPIAAIGSGAKQTWDMVVMTLDFLGGIITGRHSARSVGGPIMIAQLSGQVARMGLMETLAFMALLSVNLAVINLLPIPVLDGGHLVFLGIEGIRRRPLSIEQRMRLSQLGFIVIIGIMVWAIGNDLMRWFGI
ncbi:MAG TPA: RIP metalloprotease RseP [Longimicrobiales bacterium]|nr:RIP metalloprotease RseP [Longimicrobiales bacterium]